MSEKIGFADAVRGGGDAWRVHGLLENGGIKNKRAAALFMASDPLSHDYDAFYEMLRAQKYRAGMGGRPHFALPCRFRCGATE